mgnify:CR=1 FL=1
MKQLRNVLTALLNVLAGVSLIAMVALTCWQVFTRYVLQNPSPWSEELVAISLHGPVSWELPSSPANGAI